MIQAFFHNTPQALKEFEENLSRPRFQRYIDEAQGDPILAVHLYQWNILLSQALHVPLHGWEIGLRNRFNLFFQYKYGTLEWAFIEKYRRQLKSEDRRKLEETVLRQSGLHQNKTVTTASVVADLTAGIWVSFLSNHYENPYTLRGNPGDNLYRIFPKARHTTRTDIYNRCDSILTLRNRVAHYEPIFHLNLRDRYNDIRYMMGVMSTTWHTFFEKSCTFEKILLSDPRAQKWRLQLPWK